MKLPKIKSSMAEDIAYYREHPEQLKAEIEASKAHLLRLLYKLTKKDTSSTAEIAPKDIKPCPNP